MRAVVTGATGFIGRKLLDQLDSPVVLTRDVEKATQLLSGQGVKAFHWEPQSGPPPSEAFDGIDVVFHLAGEAVAEGRWTAAKKRRLRESRVTGTGHLVQALCQLDRKPEVLVSASAVGYYGDRRDQILDESAAPGNGFLAEICVAWESESQQASRAGIRVVNPRIGIVLGANGGAMAKMLTPFKMGLGSPLGSGRQWMPWIHIDDLVELLLLAARNNHVAGPINATAPHPVTNREFTKTLGRVLRRPTILPSIPTLALRLGLGDFGQVLLASQKAVPKAVLSAGFEFRYPHLEGALRNVLA